MAMRAGLTMRLRLRLLSTSFFSSKSVLPLAAKFTTDATAGYNGPAPSTTLFVAGLNKTTSSEQLCKAFSKFGEVEQARVAMDHASGQSRGYGFVTYATLEDSAKGLEGMNTQELEGWIIFVEYARPKTPRGQSAFQRPYHSNQFTRY